MWNTHLQIAIACWLPKWTPTTSVVKKSWNVLSSVLGILIHALIWWSNVTLMDVSLASHGFPICHAHLAIKIHRVTSHLPNDLLIKVSSISLFRWSPDTSMHACTSSFRAGKYTNSGKHKITSKAKAKKWALILESSEQTFSAALNCCYLFFMFYQISQCFCCGPLFVTCSVIDHYVLKI